MTAPRQISEAMIAEMRKSAGRVWKQHKDSVPPGDHAEWELLVKRHVANAFQKMWGSG